MKKWLMSIGILLSAIGAITGFLASSMSASLIVALGIGTFRLLKIGALVSASVSACMICASFVIPDKQAEAELLESEQQASLTVQEKVEDVSFSNDSSPEAVREQLKRLYHGTKNGTILSIIEDCISQMDLMDKRQEQLQRLLDLNDARELKNLTSVLDDVEVRLCRNNRKVINLIVTADEDELDRELANRYIKDNVSKLEKTRELLWAARDYINEYDTETQKGDAKNVTIQAYIDTLQEQLKQEVER